jgi:hypothetical protein
MTGVGVLLCGIIGGSLIAIAGGTPADATYIGTDKCKACHLKQYKTWGMEKHAKNFAVLLEPERKDPECLKCHSTGYGKPTGFTSIDETPALANTGCEACHGPGSAHAEAAKNAPESGPWDMKTDRIIASACVGCHNPHINQKERVEQLRKEKGIK